ncbi:MAG: hypothetical protein KME35_07365 [Aphanocapsa sp. GSE-SYN-MK-11-07L]|jgi:hypothetical protein|nr:hypothetical protein [Aphanocapsa sp. GSE-SYN-MK-11-07L]
MAEIKSHVESSKTFSSFFGPLTLEPGINSGIDDKRWNNCKKFNQDVQILLKQGALEELSQSGQ